MLTDSGGYQVFSLDPEVSDEGPSSVPPTTAPRICSRRSAQCASRSCSAPTSRWCSTSVPTPAVAAARCCAERCDRTAALGVAGAEGAQPDRGPGPVRHRAGRRGRSICAASRPSDRLRWASTAMPSVGCRWARRRSEMLPGLEAALGGPAGRPAALPDGSRRSRSRSSRRWPAGSTCSTACCPPAWPVTAPC